MTNWKIYRIIGKERVNHSTPNYIRFGLDDYVKYENGDEKRIDCRVFSPFVNWGIGKCIEIDNDITRYKNSGYDFDSTNEVRLIDDYAILLQMRSLQKSYDILKNQDSDLQKELSEQKHINSGLVSMFNNFSVQMINETLTNSSYFTEYDLDNCRQKLKKIVDETGKKSEEQLALVTRNSTDLSVTQETLRLTQVANLALQKQISDNNEQIEEKKRELKQGLELYKKKEDEVRDLNKKNNELKDKNSELREEKSVTEIKLQRREEEVDELRGRLGQTEEEFLESKIRLKQERLELFADRLEINLEKIQNLREYFEEKISARSVNDRKEVEKKITQTKQELRSKIKMEDVQEICSRCEEITELQIKLEKLHEQQFEAKQEIPTNQ